MTTLELHGIYHELAFWQQFVKTDRFIKGWVKKIKTPELNQEVYDFIKSVPHGTVLDVGSGVCSLLNGTCNTIAVDPLGDLYKLVFDYQRHQIEPPKALPAEELPYENEFDIVHISNALDHTQNPYEAYNKLLKAVKHGGYLIIQGFVDEAIYENWAGFHQWNLDLNEKGHLEIRNLTTLWSIEDEPTKYKKIQIGEKQWFYYIIKK